MSGIALVAGGTGLVGSHLVNLLVKTKTFDEVKILVRKGSSFQMNGVTIIDVDYDRLMDFERFLKADVVFCCLGTTIKKAGSKENFHRVDFDYPLELAKISLKNGARQYNIVTAGGANSKSLFFYNRVKGDIEKSLINLEFQNLNIFRPSLLLGSRSEKRLGEDIGAVVAKVINPILLGKMRKYRAIHAETVARSMLNISTKNQNGVHIVESDTIQKLGQV